MRAPTWRSISWVRLVDRRADAAARGDTSVSELPLDRGPSARFALLICSCFVLLLRLLAAVRPAGQNPLPLDLAACSTGWCPRLNGCHVSKLRQGCAAGASNAVHICVLRMGARVDSPPVLMVPTLIRSEPYTDAPDF